MGASNGRAHYLADHLLLGGRKCLSLPDTLRHSEWAISCGENLPLTMLTLPTSGTFGHMTEGTPETSLEHQPKCC